MKNLIALAPKTILQYITPEEYRDFCGSFTSPRNGRRVDEEIRSGVMWAADNDCFVEYRPDRLLRWLKRRQADASSCLFFNAPDVIQDAVGTLERFDHWQPIISALGWKTAFTIQNGMEEHRVPWERIDALFIGGSTEMKYSRYTFEIIQEAKKRGLWVHNGRVNTISAIRLSQAMGCDSFDGTGYVTLYSS
jgi:hypothetical protein